MSPTRTSQKKRIRLKQKQNRCPRAVRNGIVKSTYTRYHIYAGFRKETTRSVIVNHTPQGIYLHYGFTEFKRKSPASNYEIYGFYLFEKICNPIFRNHFRRDGFGISSQQADLALTTQLQHEHDSSTVHSRNLETETLRCQKRCQFFLKRKLHTFFGCEERWKSKDKHRILYKQMFCA